jgi:hypothetical protein
MLDIKKQTILFTARAINDYIINFPINGTNYISKPDNIFPGEPLIVRKINRLLGRVDKINTNETKRYYLFIDKPNNTNINFIPIVALDISPILHLYIDMSCDQPCNIRWFATAILDRILHDPNIVDKLLEYAKIA